MVENSKHVYCEKKFLEHCISTIANWKFCEENFVELQLWLGIKRMIFSSNIILHLDITFDEIDDIERKNRQERSSYEEVIMKIIEKQKSNSDREPGIQLKITDFVKLQNIDKNNNVQLTAYYFTICDSETCQKYMDECGVLAICPENIKEFKGIIYDNGVAINKNQEISWDSILKFYPKQCNSLIITDNYILSDTNSKDNLIDIFRIILPQSLDIDIPFQISIFTQDIDWQIDWQLDDPIDSGEKSKQEKFYSKMAQTIEILRPNLRFKLCIFKCSSETFHDRILVTNNYYINCGGGFNLIKQNGSKSGKMTSINIVYPYLNSSIKWTTVAYSNFINNVSSIYNSKNLTQLRNITDNTAYIGNKNNRLFKTI